MQIILVQAEHWELNAVCVCIVVIKGVVKARQAARALWMDTYSVHSCRVAPVPPSLNYRLALRWTPLTSADINTGNTRAWPGLQTSYPRFSLWSPEEKFVPVCSHSVSPACAFLREYRGASSPGIRAVPVNSVAVGHHLGARLLAQHTHPQQHTHQQHHFHLQHLTLTAQICGLFLSFL